MGIGSFFNPILAGGGTVSSMDVDFIASTQSTTAGATISFTNLSDPTPIFNFWEFGDGSFSTASNPDKIYSSLGTFSVTLNACDLTSGGIKTKTDYISMIDPDVEAFLTATSITDSTIINAITDLVGDLKSNNLWDRMYAIYPFVGGTSSTHKYNLKDPRDLNEAYRLAFGGGITHNSDGITGNGIDGFADTFLPPSQALFQFDNLNHSMHFSVYIRNNTSGGFQEMGILDSIGSSNETGLIPRFSDNRFYSIIAGNGFPFTPNSDSRGFFAANRQVSNFIEGWKNGVRVINASSGNTSLYISDDNFNLLCRKIRATNSRDRFSDRNLAFASIGRNLTTTQSENFYTVVQSFQTILGRNI